MITYLILLILFLGPIIVCYLGGTRLRKKYHIPSCYFWTAFAFVIPIIAAPIVFFLSLFNDHPKNPENETYVFLLVNTYAFWLIAGFFMSLRLYCKYRSFYSLLPSLLSWLGIVGSISLAITIN